jgi:Uma2 family endonuclease
MARITTSESLLNEQGMIPPVPVYRLSVDRYHKMIQAGVFTEDDRLELLDGWLVPTMTKNPPHRAATRLLLTALERAIPAGWYADSQSPITLPTSEPEPDLVVVRGETRQYLDRHPGSMEVGLVVEISHSTLSEDRTFKKRLYARAGIPACWIVNLIARRVEVYTNPAGSAEQADYQSRQDYLPADSVPLVLEGRAIELISVAAILP